MAIPTRLLIAGAFAALLILGADWLNDRHLEAALESMRLTCLAETANDQGEASVCDPIILVWTNDPRRPHQGIQARLSEMQEAIRAEHERFVRVALIAPAVSAIPLTCSLLMSIAQKLARDRMASRQEHAKDIQQDETTGGRRLT